MKSLDNNGLAYLWSKLKTYISSRKYIKSEDESVTNQIYLDSIEELNKLVRDGELIEGADYFINDGSAFAATSSTPVGCGILWFGLSTKVPSNYLLAEGQLLLIKDYPTLFDKYGTTYGGDGITTFALPNLKGKIVVHLDGSQAEFNTLGKTGGVKATNHGYFLEGINSSNAQVGGRNYQNSVATRIGEWVNQTATVNVSHLAAISQVGGNIISNNGTANTEVCHGQYSSTNLSPYLTAYYIIKVREEVYTEDLINLDKVILALQDKVNSLTDLVHLVDSGGNGLNGYRIYSDGYCEQWGNFNLLQAPFAFNTNYIRTITLHKEFKDTNYNVSIIKNAGEYFADIEPGIQITGNGTFNTTYWCPKYVSTLTEWPSVNLIYSWRATGYTNI